MKEEQFFEQSISKQIWKENYKWSTDLSPIDTFKRIAVSIAAIEKQKSLWGKKYYELISDLRFIPGGRIISNAGTGLRGTSLVNCFVSGFQGKAQDSIDSIYQELTRQAKILKSEGGYGCNFNVIRPRGAYIKGIGVESPGTTIIMQLWNESSTVITSGNLSGTLKNGKNKIRKGAMMGVLSCWHPGIEEFITAKQKPGALTKFNLSILISDEFINAVKNKAPWQLLFPDTESKHYDSHWDGNINKWKKNGFPIKIWKEYSNANQLWDLIMHSTYNYAEPGVLFEDRINGLNNLNYIEEINSTNPCGEQPLPRGGSCVLSSINLTKYINNKKNDFDYTKLAADIPTMVRFLDAVIDITLFPLKEQQKEAQDKRRIGIGYMGYASALYMLGKKYGSDETISLTDKLASFVTNKIYCSSALLAREKGAFPLYKKDKYLKSNFIKQALNKKTKKMITEIKIRNSHLTTIAPTGNTSLLANNVSSGIEPVINHQYTRTIVTQTTPRNLILPEKINWEADSCQKLNDWNWIREGKELLLTKKFNGITYKIDRNRGLTREQTMTDYAVFNLGKNFNKNAGFAVTLFNLTINDHINTMQTFSRYIDSAVSKTVNLPNDYPFADFKNVYMTAYNSGTIKGLTTYRMGTMTSVISSSGSDKKEKDIFSTIIERPYALQCDLIRTAIKGKKWIIFIGLYKGKPFEVFAGKIKNENIPDGIKNGKILKEKSHKYSFEYNGEILIENIIKTFESDENESISRLISMSLRHNTPLDFIIEQLNKSKGSVVDFSKSIMRALKKYQNNAVSKGNCPACGAALLYIEGCVKCLACSWSKCE